MRHVLFYRDLKGFNGGHLKVWDYFNHVAQLPGHEPVIHFSDRTIWTDANPWRQWKDRQDLWRTLHPDAYFFSASDWLSLTPAQRQQPPAPVINLIQHPHHADPREPRSAFLRHRAIRICVSQEVADAVRASGQANGPVFVIPNGVDRQALQQVRRDQKTTTLLIAAFKSPPLGQELHRRLAPTVGPIELLTSQLPRPQFLSRIAAAETAVLLPNPQEGFYLPALEAMALRTLVICPDCVGNRAFCLPGRNCYRPLYTVDAIEQAVRAALHLTHQERQPILDTAEQTLARHDLLEERQAFHRILLDIDPIWQGPRP